MQPPGAMPCPDDAMNPTFSAIAAAGFMDVEQPASTCESAYERPFVFEISRLFFVSVTPRVGAKNQESGFSDIYLEGRGKTDTGFPMG